MVMKSVGGRLSQSMRAKQKAQAAFDLEAQFDQLGQSIQTEERAAAELEGRARETAALEAELRALKADPLNVTASRGIANSTVACKQKVMELKTNVNDLNNEIFGLRTKTKELSNEKNALLSSVMLLGKDLERELQRSAEEMPVASAPGEPAQMPAASTAGEPVQQEIRQDAEPAGRHPAPGNATKAASAARGRRMGQRHVGAAGRAGGRRGQSRRQHILAARSRARGQLGRDRRQHKLGHGRAQQGQAQSEDAIENSKLTKIVKSELARNKKLKEEKIQLSRKDEMLKKIEEENEKLVSVRQSKQGTFALNWNLTKQFEALTVQLHEAQDQTARRVFAQSRHQKLANEVLQLEREASMRGTRTGPPRPFGAWAQRGPSRRGQ